MFEAFGTEKWLSISMFALFGFSIVLRIVLAYLYGRMIRETENMAVTKNTILRQCKLKFVNCFQLNNGVNNVPVFVDKWMGRMAIGPFGFEEMYHFSQQTMLLAVVLDGVAICRSIANGRAMHLITPFYIACFAGLYLFFSVSEAADIRRRRRILKINLVDYLENHLSSRILTTKEDMEMLGLKPGKTIEMIPMGKRSPNEFHEKEPDSMEIQREEAQQNILPENAEGTGNAEEDNSRAVTQEELEALLKEFLVVQ